MKPSIVVNCTQVGIAMELHGHKPDPVMLELISYAQLTSFRATLEQTNPGMRHACIGQVAVMLAEKMYTLPVTLAR